MSRSSTMRRTASRRGYTMVEVMMGLAILAVGATAIIALQRFSVLGTMTARHLTNATNVSSSVIEQMNIESGLWTTNSGTFNTGTMPWLGTALNSTAWVAPANHAFLIDGTPVDATTATADTPVAYCTHVRSTWLGNRDAIANTFEATDIVRIEVRTFFAKSGRSVAIECKDWTGAQVETLFGGGSLTVSGVTGPRTREEYGAVYLTTIVRRTSI